MMKKLPRIHVPLLKPEDVIPYLGKGEAHWRDGYSAKMCAESWFAANDIPESIRALLDQSEAWSGAVLLDAYLERCVDLQDGVQGATQSDVMAICRLADGTLGVLSVEAKVNEDFGPRVREWLGPDGRSAHKTKRFAMLCERLGLDPAGDHGALRYQLFHRTAGALLEAERYGATQAAMIVQSFSATNNHFDDFEAFGRALGLEPQVGGLCALPSPAIPTLIGWCRSA